MPGAVDPRSIAGMQNGLIVLDKGLDLSSHKFFAPIGSLADCWNVEMVDGRLQVIPGTMRLGGNTRNRLAIDFWVLTGVETTDFDMLAGDFNETPTLVQWYAGAATTPSVQPAGRGLLVVRTQASATSYGGKAGALLFMVEGETPDNYTFFKEVGGSARTFSIVTTERFHRPGHPWNDMVPYDLFYFDSIMNDSFGFDSANTWDTFRPDPLGYGAVSHVFGYQDQTYAVKDFPVIRFEHGIEEPSIGDKIQIANAAGTDPIFYVARAELEDGSWEGGDAYGWLYVYPQSDSTLVPGDIDGWDSSVAINNLTTTNQCADTYVQTSPASVQVQKSHGLLWKLDDEAILNTGWKYIDAGYSVRFNNGAVAPVVSSAPLFVTDSVDVVQDTGFIDFDSPATELPLTGTYSGWSNLGNLAADDAAYASNTILAGDSSRIIRLGVPLDSIPGEAKILGIEVKLEAGGTGGTGVTLSKVQFEVPDLIGTASDNGIDPIYYLSENRAPKATHEFGAGYDILTFGGQLDLWGFPLVNQSDLNGQNFYLWIQFANSSVANRTINVDYVSIKVHYALTAQPVYVYDGTSDVSTGNLIGYQVHDGEWSTNDASGWMSFSSLATPSDIPYGAEIWTGATGTGTKIAEVMAVSKNILPSYKEMETAGTRCRSYESNLGSGNSASRVFITNGVSPCFTVGPDGNVQFIRTPVAPDKDHPRYVSEIANHLVLDIDGYAFVSSIGSFNNFSTYDGATTWNTNDEITGLVKAPANTLMVLCRDSLHTLTGSGASGGDSFKLTTHSTSGGSRHYTAQYVGEPMFLDNYGLATFSTTDKYGDFDENSMNFGIEPWLRPRLASHTKDTFQSLTGPMDSYLVRSKGQLRVLFKDNWQLTATLPGPEAQDPRPQFTLQNPALTIDTVNSVYHQKNSSVWSSFTYTCVTSYVTSWGEERILLGNLAGRVLLGEQGTHNQGSVIYHSFAINPIHGANPLTDILKVSALSVLYDMEAAAHAAVDVATDGELPTWVNFLTTANQLASGTRASSGPYSRELHPRLGTFHGFAMSNAIAWRIMGSTSTTYGMIPPIYRALAPVTSSKGTARSRVTTSQTLGSTTGVSP